jgi:hypothetical protein
VAPSGRDRVTVSFIVLPDGTVNPSSIMLLEVGAPTPAEQRIERERLAVEAAASCTFSPARHGDEAVAVRSSMLFFIVL